MASPSQVDSATAGRVGRVDRRHQRRLLASTRHDAAGRVWPKPPPVPPPSDRPSPRWCPRPASPLSPVSYVPPIAPTTTGTTIGPGEQSGQPQLHQIGSPRSALTLLAVVYQTGRQAGRTEAAGTYSPRPAKHDGRPKTSPSTDDLGAGTACKFLIRKRCPAAPGRQPATRDVRSSGIGAAAPAPTTIPYRSGF